MTKTIVTWPNGTVVAFGENSAEYKGLENFVDNQHLMFAEYPDGAIPPEYLHTIDTVHSDLRQHWLNGEWDKLIQPEIEEQTERWPTEYDLPLPLPAWQSLADTLDEFPVIHNLSPSISDELFTHHFDALPEDVRKAYKEGNWNIPTTAPGRHKENHMDEENNYIGTKIIRATPQDGKDGAPGYKVIYPDGYVSWSPKETFEQAYRKVTPAETALITG